MRTAPLEPIVLDVVRAEIVDEGRRGGHADAAALAGALDGIPLTTTADEGRPVDARLLAAARDVGVLVANDLALGRRARSLGIAWIRTADLVVLAVRSGSLPPAEGVAGLNALEHAGRITPELGDAYREELR